MSDLGPEADGTAGAAAHPTRSAAPARTPGTWGLRADLLRHGAGHSSDKVGYVELFFDLVFVFAVTQLSHSLIAHPDVETLLHTLILGAAVWYLWIDTTWVTNWLDPDRLPVRTMLIVLMALGLVMSSAIPEAFDSKALLFAVPYVTIQVGRSVFAALALNRRWSENGAGFLRITAWVSVSGILWITGALVDDGLRLGLWGAAVLIDYAGPRAMFAVPFFGRTDPRTWTVRADHMAERVSLFVIISLGESIIITGTAFAEPRGDGGDPAVLRGGLREHGPHVVAVLRQVRAARDRVLRPGGLHHGNGRADGLHVRAVPPGPRDRAHGRRRRASCCWPRQVVLVARSTPRAWPRGRSTTPGLSRAAPRRTGATRGRPAWCAGRPPCICSATCCSAGRRADAGRSPTWSASSPSPRCSRRTPGQHLSRSTGCPTLCCSR